MQYHNIICGYFVSRPNRFIAHVEIPGQEQIEICHVKNTGRCRELLVPGCRVYLEEGTNPGRKTKYDLVAVEKNIGGKTILVNMDSQAPNRAVYEWLISGRSPFADIKNVKPEYSYGDSRVDFYVEYEDEEAVDLTEKDAPAEKEAVRKDFLRKKLLIEVKGVTLETDGIVRFPDAPTLRGLKHIRELTGALEEGYEACILFVIQMKDESLLYFEPNDETQPEFRTALAEGKRRGLRVMAYDCSVTPDSMRLEHEFPCRV